MPSKRFKQLPEKTKNLNAETFEKLIPELKKNCTTKFDESLDLSFQINNKQKKSEVNIRTVVNLPGGTGKKVNIERSQEAIDTGADEVAVACPFCYIMMDDGVKELGFGDNVKVRDVSLILLDNLKKD